MSSSDQEIRSNLAHWQEMQQNDYFEKHPCYDGLTDKYPSEVALIESFVPLRPEMKVVVIGCGYGRESAHIAPRVKRLYGIDVSERILDKAIRYLGERGVKNFTPVLAERYARDVPKGIDLVFSIVVMQHLTRDLVRDYFGNLSAKLRPGGVMLIQFLETLSPHAARDADLKTYEPSVSWSKEEIEELAPPNGLEVIEIRTPPSATGITRWHWAFMRKPRA